MEEIKVKNIAVCHQGKNSENYQKYKKIIKENILNNNSIVLKINYKNNFSMIFTGDIEKIAEKEIINEYKNSNLLKSDILKVGHHGSKTSTTQEFLEKISPKIALIGVRQK